MGGGWGVAGGLHAWVGAQSLGGHSLRGEGADQRGKGGEWRRAWLG